MPGEMAAGTHPSPHPPGLILGHASAKSLAFRMCVSVLRCCAEGPLCAGPASSLGDMAALLLPPPAPLLLRLEP